VIESKLVSHGADRRLSGTVAGGVHGFDAVLERLGRDPDGHSYELFTAVL
jgi:hypothetical protein